MKIECPHCHKTYDVPEEHIKRFGEHVVFSCPVCKGKIEINHKFEEKEPETKSASSASSGESTDEVLKNRILKTVKDLPPMPQVAQKARQVTADEGSSFSDLAKVIETDQAIATRVLKLSNSPYYGVMGNVTSIQHAAVVLGIKTLNGLLTLACASSLLGSELKGYGLSSGDLWKHSLVVAGCARTLANRKNPGLAEDAFSAGLIHDCGKLILDKYIYERKAEFDNFMKGGQKSFLEAEKHILGFDHSRIAAEVCEKWQIPEKLILVIGYHHNPSALQYNELAYIVHAADAIAMMSAIGAGADSMLYQIEEKAVEFLELDSNYISTVMAEAVEYAEKTVSEM